MTCARPAHVNPRLLRRYAAMLIIGQKARKGKGQE